jgi:polysaccharide export outer membrane protein
MRKALLAAALLAAGAHALAQAPRTQTRPAAPEAAAPAAPQAQAQAQAQAPAPAGESDYQIGPGDILSVTVYGHPDLTQTILVQPDGTFTFPLVGRVKGSDLTPAELEKKLGILLARGFIRNPQVTVVVQEFRSKTVYVVGEVARPGPYPLSGRTSLLELLAKAGGTANAGSEVVIVRPPKGAPVSGPVLPADVAAGAAGAGGEAPPDAPKAEVFRVAMGAIQAGELEKNLALQPNDTVFVPPAAKAFVTGEVRSPGAYAWFPGLTARQLISLAGGLTPDGSDGRLKVVRTADGKTREDKIKLDEPMKPGETLVVRRRLF